MTSLDDAALEFAVLVLLEKLTPTERAAYVLREAFDGEDTLVLRHSGAVMASADVAAAVVDVALAAPLNGVREIGGPEVFGMDELAREVETQPVVTDPTAAYFGAAVPGDELLPGVGAVLYKTSVADWRAGQEA